MAPLTMNSVVTVILSLLPVCLCSNLLTINPNVREHFFEKGSTQPLECTVTYNGISSHELDWIRNDGTTDKRIQATLSFTVDQQKKVATLKASILADVEGTYTCQFRNSTSKEIILSQDIELMLVHADFGDHDRIRRQNKDDKTNDTVTNSTSDSVIDNTSVKSNTSSEFKAKETKVEPKFEKNTEILKLSCEVEIPKVDPKNILPPEWYINNTKVADKNDKRISFENNTMIIKEAMRKDAGLYTARFDVKDNGKTESYDCHVAVKAGPLVLDFEKSKNLIQGDNMDLRCNVLGYPPAVITWYKDDKVINESMGDSRVKLAPIKDYKNAQLIITEVDYDDAGTYKCEAKSAALNETNTKTIVVRVKDKLAALWPFLGIVAEVIVLCTIIFIYEKRRNKQADQANHDAHEADGAANDNVEGLRHRNTPANNPRA